jgi:hypothetical protein
MTVLSKKFIFIFLLLFMGCIGAFMTSIFIPQDYSKNIAFSKITTIPGLALSTSYLEPRVREYSKYSNVLYPSLFKIDNMDFVYEP